MPALLFGATLFAAVARTITHHHSPLLASGLFVLLLVGAGKTTMWWPPIEAGIPPLFEVVEHLGAMPKTPGTRLYGDAGTALPLAFYSGLPVQNVMPVRRAFLDGYPGDIVIVEGPATMPLTGSEVRQSLTAKGVAIGEPEGLRLARHIRHYAAQDRLRSRGAVVCSDEPPVPALSEDLMRLQDDKTRRQVVEQIAAQGNPMFKGFRIDTLTEMWQVFFYRFIDSRARMGAGLNYAARMSGATATIRRSGWVILRSRAGIRGIC